MSNEKTALSEIIDREILQQLQDSISKTANISAIILDAFEQPVTQLTNARGICGLTEEIHNPCGACEEMRKELCRMACEAHEPIFTTCPVSGMQGVTIPIILDETFLGVWIIGQVRFHDDKPISVEETARKREISSAAARKLLEDIPVLKRSEFKMIVDFVLIVTAEVVKLASSSMEIKKKNEQLTDATESLGRSMEDELFNLAYYDRSLQIPNSDRMEQDLRESRHEYLVAVNLNDLRRINNTFGRACGDELLKAVRDYILEMDIPNSTLYRGKLGDFNILFKCTGEDGRLPYRIADKIHDRCKKAWEIPIYEHVQNFFTSVNVCVIPLGSYQEHFFSYLYSALEHSLDIARKTDDVIIYDDNIHREIHAGLELELSIKNAVREDMRGFEVVFQPIVDMRVAMWVGVEALCRWDSHDFGPVPPDVFIPVAEANGLIGVIGLWVLEQAIMHIKALGLDRIEKFLLEVNLSPLQLLTPDLDQIIMELLKKYDYPPNKLGLEVTESSELNFSGHAMEVIVRLNQLGVVIVLDDFGTGYSSFNSLHKLPVQVLKTDRSFITGVESDSHLQRLLCIMVTLAHGSDLKLVAEGVESDLQARFLLEQGTDFFQGYFFSRPLNNKQLEEKLDNFYYPNDYLLSIGHTKWDLSGLNDNQIMPEEYGLNPSMYKLLNRCLRKVLTNPDSNSVIDDLIELIGQSLRVSRSYVFLKEPNGTYSSTNEWCASGITPEKDNLQGISLAQMYPQWTDTLMRDGLLVASDIRTLEKSIFDVLNRQGIKAVVQFPIWRDSELYGFVGFNHCDSVHCWTREEVQMLHTLTGLIVTVLEKIWIQDKSAIPV